MILHINEKLNVWADWVATGRRVRGLGYPSQVAFMRLTPSSNTLRMPVENETAWEIERAVHALDRQLREVVEQFYLRAGTAETHAKALRICRDTLYVRLHNAHVKIMEAMQLADDLAELKKCLTASDRIATKHVR